MKADIDVKYINEKLVLIARVGEEEHPIVVMGPEVAREIIRKLQEKLNEI